MSSLGVYLRGLREAKGVSLDDISRSTRVGRRHLEALESDKLEDLPARVFVKGFIRAYCDTLEAPPDQAFDLFRQTAGEPARAERSTSRPSFGARPRRGGPLLVSAILVLALGGSLFALHLGLKGPARERVQPSSVTPERPSRSRSPPPHPRRRLRPRHPRPARRPSPRKPSRQDPIDSSCAPSSRPGSASRSTMARSPKSSCRQAPFASGLPLAGSCSRS